MIKKFWKWIINDAIYIRKVIFHDGNVKKNIEIDYKLSIPVMLIAFTVALYLIHLYGGIL